MIVFKRMNFNLIKTCPGIYCIENIINGKCYIGRALNLRKRLREHFNNYKQDQFKHLIIYKAMNYYGVENFKIHILFEGDKNNPDINQILDEKEIFYIKQYDSYNNGYNSTLGGDGGVLGYKHSEETIEHIRQIQLQHKKDKEKDTNNWVKAKNIYTNQEIIGYSYQDLADKLNVTPNSVRSYFSFNYKLLNNCWICAKYHDDYKEISQTDRTIGMPLTNKQKILDYIKQNPRCTYKEISSHFKVSQKTFYNYKNELGISFEQRIDAKTNKEEFCNYIQTHTKEETIKHFNIHPRTYYKWIKLYCN